MFANSISEPIQMKPTIKYFVFILVFLMKIYVMNAHSESPRPTATQFSEETALH